MLNLVVYLAIGIAAILLLLFLFKKVGEKELAASPRLQWEKAVEEYGEPAIISLYQNAQTDEERAEIAAFVTNELAKMNSQKEDGYEDGYGEEDDHSDEDTTARLNINDEDIQMTTVISKADAELFAQTRLIDDEPEIKKDEQALGELMSSPAYNFWQEPALTDETEEESAQINEKLQALMNEPVEEAMPEEEPQQIMPEFSPDMFDEKPAEDKPNDIPVIEETVILSLMNEPMEKTEEQSIEEEPAQEAPARDIWGMEAEDEENEEEEEAPRKKKGFFARRKEQKEAAAAEAAAIEAAEAAAAAAAAAAFAASAADTNTAAYEQQTCPECGSPIDDDYAFCIICGASLKKEEAAAPAVQEEAIQEAVVQETAVQEEVAANIQYIAAEEELPDSVAAVAEDPVAAYRASTANAYAAAAAKGLWRESDRARSALFDRSSQEASAQTIAAREQTSQERPAEDMPVQAEQTPSGDVPSLEEILANVKALEDRLFSEDDNNGRE